MLLLYLAVDWGAQMSNKDPTGPFSQQQRTLGPCYYYPLEVGLIASFLFPGLDGGITYCAFYIDFWLQNMCNVYTA